MKKVGVDALIDPKNDMNVGADPVSALKKNNKYKRNVGTSLFEMNDSKER